jgi:hypothetical protein|tara:strand:- start:3004 stop:3255 length:252 start_codon:yes stop_codon:yes gene_type:complete
MDKPTIGDDSLKNLTKLFTRIGWDKKLSELSEDEILVTILIMQFSKRIDSDEQYTKDRLDKLLLEYVYEKQDESEINEDEIPF